VNATGRRRLVWSSGIAILAVALGGIVLSNRPSPSPAAVAEPAATLTLDGDWTLLTRDGQRTPLHIRHRGDRVELRSEPLRIDNNPDWTAYIESLAGDGTRLTHVRYTASGEVFGDEVDMALMLISADGNFEVAGGNLHVRVSPDRLSLSGRVSLNSGGEEAVTLERVR